MRPFRQPNVDTRMMQAMMSAGVPASAEPETATWPARILYPGEESYEGSALVEIARLGQGVPIYAAPSNEGFAGATYGPLYYLVGSRLVNPKRPSYLPLRLLSALGILRCAGR